MSVSINISLGTNGHAHDTSSAMAHGSAICTPLFHWIDAGRLLSYSNTFSAGGVCVVSPPPSVCSCP